jgi:predicted permease
MFGRLFGRKRGSSDFKTEIQAHLQLEAERLREQGLSEEDARAAAHRAFGNVTHAQERFYESRHWLFWDNLWRDIHYAARMLRKSPGFTAVAVLTLALGIGANTAIFTVVNAVILQPLPVKAPHQLYSVGDNLNCCQITGIQGDFSIFSTALYEQLRDNTPEFSDLAAFEPQPSGAVFRRGGSPFGRTGVEEFVSGNYFRTLGVSASLGRALTPADDRPGAPPVAVMSYHAWHDLYAADPSVIGSTFLLDAIPFTVVGVMPPSFYGDTLRSDPPDVWIPISTEPLQHKQGAISNVPSLHWLYIIGRLKPGEDPAKVQSHVTAEVQQWLTAQNFPSVKWRSEIPKQRVSVISASHGVALDYGDELNLLMIVSGLVLLIACANVASLLLAKATASRLQTAIRVALGATRLRLICRQVTEGILLALLGGAAGLLLAYDGAQMLLYFVFTGATYVPIDARLSLPVFAFALALSVVTGVVFATAPAWMVSQTNPSEALRDARSTRDRSPLVRKSLVVLQAALSMTLLVGAGLVVASLHHLENQHFGFTPEHRMIVRVNPNLAGYTPAHLPELYQQIEQRFSSLPGALSASYSLYAPIGEGGWSQGISVEGNPEPNAGQLNAPSWLRVGPRYFETLGTHVLRGRAIDEQDTATSQPVAVVSETFARDFFPHQDALGKTFGIGGAARSHDFQIVGVVEDAKYQDARAPANAMFFLPYFQPLHFQGQEVVNEVRSNYISDIELRVAGAPEKMQPAVRQTLAGINPDLVPLEILPLGEIVSSNFDEERLVGELTALYGLLALVLASVGMYGVISYLVVRRTHEIGIRMALGAHPPDIFRVVLREGASLAFAGIILGVGFALAFARVMTSLLYGMSAADPLILVAAGAVLAASALAACYIPARRAMKVDPMIALRYE